MHRRTFAIAASAAALCCAVASTVPSASASAHRRAPTTPIYLDTRYPAAERAADLVSRLTLQQKAQQMNSSAAPAIPELGVAQWGWWNEAAHGVARQQTNTGANPPILTNTTSYPVSLSIGATWNPGLAYQEALQISDEAREVSPANKLHLSFWSPTVNLARDPRWGRNDESYGEDPVLTTALAAQFVNGMQGQDQQGRPLPGGHGYLKTIATLKHFAANNSEFNRLNGSSDMDERTLREYYTRQFRDIVQQANAASIMSAYNRVNGIPAPASVKLHETLGRQTFGFKGYYVSDCDAVYIMQNRHQWVPPGKTTPVDQYERSAYANASGEDLNCNQGYHDEWNYGNTIPDAIERRIVTPSGLYNEGDVDVSLVRLFTARIETGEFDAENRVPWIRAARQRLAPGTWENADSNNAVTQTPARLALAERVAEESLVLLKNDNRALPLKVPSSGNFRVAVMGEYANPEELYLGGYSSIQGPAGRAKHVNVFQGVKAAVQKINPNATVDYHRGLTGDDLNAVDPAAVAAAKNYDVVVVVGGTDADTADEAADRPDLALPGAQAQLISQVADQNPNTIAYLETMGQVDLDAFASKVPAILWSSYNGQRQGAALADVLLGTANPSGRLPFTWYQGVSQLPPIDDYNIRPTSTTPGRTYQYFTGQPSYPFGHGLSYSDFKYSNLRVDKRTADANGTLRVTVDVNNRGSRTGATVPQLYVATPSAPASAQRPKKRLSTFQKVTVAPGKTKRVAFTVQVPTFAFYDEAAHKYKVDPGTYELQLASSSDQVAARTSVRVGGTLKAAPTVVNARPVQAGDAAQGISQRVRFAPNTVVDPQLTVSLADESIYGYVTKGQSTPLPKGLTVTYRSNRPNVVSVGRDQTIRTGQPGIATVTATVHYLGRTVSTSFVVNVAR